MPACQGRPEGPCPDGINDASVKFSVSDLFLCKDCEDFRIPSSKVSDNADNITTKSLASCTKSYVNSEMLCFVVDKGRVLAFDQLVKICTDFYKEEEILAARQVIDGVGSRLPKRQGPNKLRSTVEDIVKVVLNPTVDLPEFHAIKLSRLPPIDITHCDTAAILKELQGLRAEVREIRQLQAEVQDLRSKMQDVSTLCVELGAVRSDAVVVAKKVDNLWTELTAIKNQIDQQQNQSVLQNNQADNGTIKLDSMSKDPDCGDSTAPADQHGYSHVLQNSIQSGVFKTVSRKPLPKNTQAKKNIVRPSVIGVSSKQSNVRSVTTKRAVDIFISRLHPATDEHDIRELIKDIAPHVSDDDIVCYRLKSKYEQLYCSYSVSVRVNAVELKSHIELLLAAESWPSGLLIRRYFQPKRNHGDV
jgi:hypothetical protein